MSVATGVILNSGLPVFSHLLFSSLLSSLIRKLKLGLLTSSKFSTVIQRQMNKLPSVLSHCPLAISPLLCVQLREWTERMKGYDLRVRRFCLSLEVLLKGLVEKQVITVMCVPAVRFDVFHLFMISSPSP